MRYALAGLADKELRRLEDEAIAATANEWNPYGVPEDFGEFMPLCRIRSGRKVIPFLPYEYQIEISRIIDAHRGAVFFKTRQLGITEVISAKFLHQAVLNPGYVAAVVSIGQTESSNVSLRVKRMPQAIPGFKFSAEAATVLKINKGGTILFRPSTMNAIRSFESVGGILFDEAAFIRGIEEVYSTAMPSQDMLGDEARTIVVSTMSEQGELSWFWQLFDSGNGSISAKDMVERVKDGREEPLTYWVDESGWAKVIVHWKSHPIYSSIPNYLQHVKLKNKITEAKLQREYNLGIPVAGSSLFNSQALIDCATGRWEDPKPGRRYLCCIDPNFGGSDFWDCQVWDVTSLPYKLVHNYRESERQTTHCRKQTIAVMDRYRPVLTAIESNSGGIVIAEDMMVDRPGYRIELTHTTATTKVINTDRIAMSLEQYEVIFPPDWQGINEAKRFSLVDRCGVGEHDDTICSWAAGWAWIDQLPRLTLPSRTVAPSRPNSDRSIRQDFK